MTTLSEQFNNHVLSQTINNKLNEIEKIEVSLRSTIANVVAEETGNIFWMTDATMYANSDKFNKTMELVNKELRSSKEDFIKHFKGKYTNNYPPAWMLVEILPLGVVTRIFENIADNALRKKIAGRFNPPQNDMKDHLKQLLSQFPNVDITAMGFPLNWEEEPLWQD